MRAHVAKLIQQWQRSSVRSLARSRETSACPKCKHTYLIGCQWGLFDFRHQYHSGSPRFYNKYILRPIIKCLYRRSHNTIWYIQMHAHHRTPKGLKNETSKTRKNDIGRTKGSTSSLISFPSPYETVAAFNREAAAKYQNVIQTSYKFDRFIFFSYLSFHLSSLVSHVSFINASRCCWFLI